MSGTVHYSKKEQNQYICPTLSEKLLNQIGFEAEFESDVSVSRLEMSKERSAFIQQRGLEVSVTMSESLKQDSVKPDSVEFCLERGSVKWRGLRGLWTSESSSSESPSTDRLAPRVRKSERVRAIRAFFFGPDLPTWSLPEVTNACWEVGVSELHSILLTEATS